LLTLLLGSLAVLADVNLDFNPFILAQKDLRLFADLEPGFSLDGFVVTAIDNLDPGFAALYEAIPFLFKPPLADLYLLYVAMLLFYHQMPF
jgi:hypothetical protein